MNAPEAMIRSLDARLPADALRSAAEAAAARVAPFWPLQHFVAVNPFLGLAGESWLAHRRRTMDQVSGTILISTAATLALLHTAIGVDHSVPFFVVGRAHRGR